MSDFSTTRDESVRKFPERKHGARKVSRVKPVHIPFDAPFIAPKGSLERVCRQNLTALSEPIKVSVRLGRCNSVFALSQWLSLLLNWSVKGSPRASSSRQGGSGNLGTSLIGGWSSYPCDPTNQPPLRQPSLQYDSAE